MTTIVERQSSGRLLHVDLVYAVTRGLESGCPELLFRTINASNFAYCPRRNLLNALPAYAVRSVFGIGVSRTLVKKSRPEPQHASYSGYRLHRDALNALPANAMKSGFAIGVSRTSRPELLNASHTVAGRMSDWCRDGAFNR